MNTGRPIALRVVAAVMVTAGAWGGAWAVGQNAPATPASLDEARQLVTKGEYPSALKMIAELLKSDGAGGDRERYDLLSLRGECLLQMGQRGSAITAFEQASRVAPDRATEAMARATMALVKKSGGGAYKPTGGKEAIDIKSVESRGRAMAAYSADLAAELQPKVERVVAGTTLPPMISLLSPVLEWAAVEYAATGNGGEAATAAGSMGKRARELMLRDLKKSSYRLDEVIATSQVGGWGSFTTQRSGEAPMRSLTTPQSDELRDLRVYVKQIGKTAGEARNVAREQEGNVAAWDAVVAQATDLVDRMDAILGQ